MSVFINPGSLRPRRFVCLFLAGLLLQGCGSLNFFQKDEVRLSGERKSVRQLPGERGDAVLAAAEPGSVRIPAAVANADWPQINGSAMRAIGHVAAPASLSEAWRADVGSGSRGRIVSPPIIAGGRVYAMDSGASVTAVDASSGAAIWTADLTPEGENTVDGFGGGLAASGERLFVSSGFGVLHGLNATTGEVIWNTLLRAPSRAAPAVAGGRVFSVTRENRLFAFEAETGKPLWDRRGLEQTAGLLGGAAPAATEEVVVAPFSSGELSAYLAATGRPIWDVELSGLRGAGGLAVLNDVAGDPVIAGEQVIAASQAGRLAAVDLKSGERLWTQDIGGASPPYVAGDAVFFVSNGGRLVALAADSGAVLWSVELGAFEDPDDLEDPIVWSGPVLAGGRLLLVSNTERMISVDPATGQTLAEIALPGGASVPPVVAGGTVYVLTDDATLVAYR